MSIINVSRQRSIYSVSLEVKLLRQSQLKRVDLNSLKTLLAVNVYLSFFKKQKWYRGGSWETGIRTSVWFMYFAFHCIHALGHRWQNQSENQHLSSSGFS